MKICAVSDCGRNRDTRIGYCIMHYKRFMRNGSTNRVLAYPPAGTKCSTVHCNNSGALRKGRCNACRVRLYRHGSTDMTRASSGCGTTTKAGYRLVTVNGKRVYEHRVVMTKKLGRKLLPEEVVHHLDENPENNSPDNLRLFANQSEHMKHHGGTFS